MKTKNTAYIVALAFAASVSAQAQNVTNLKAKAANSHFNVTWQMNLDSINMRRNQTVVYTPVIEDNKGNTEVMRSVVVNGRNQHYVYQRNGGNKNYPDAIEVQRKNGEAQTISYDETIALQPWMNDATVRINTDTCGCGNLVGKNDGSDRTIDVNPHWETKCALPTVQPQISDDDPVLSLAGKAYLDFPVNRTELHPDYHNNASELHKIVSTIDTVRNNPNVEITSISIHGYASPEGSYSNNTRLASGRAATLKDYVQRQYDIPASTYHVQSTPEDWDGFVEYLEKSNFSEKDKILAIARSNDDPDKKDQTIRKQYPEAYNTILASCYPYLRHSDYEIQYKIRPMSDEEAAKLINTQPELLSLTKMYRIAKLYQEGSDEYNNVIFTAAKTYPDCKEAQANAAAICIRQNDLIQAKQYLQRAGDTDEANNARGVIALMEDRYDDARELFTKAGNTENLKLVP